MRNDRNPGLPKRFDAKTEPHEHFNATSLYNQKETLCNSKIKKPSLTVYLESLNKTKNRVQDYISRTPSSMKEYKSEKALKQVGVITKLCQN